MPLASHEANPRGFATGKPAENSSVLPCVNRCAPGLEPWVQRTGPLFLSCLDRCPRPWSARNPAFFVPRSTSWPAPPDPIRERPRPTDNAVFRKQILGGVSGADLWRASFPSCAGDYSLRTSRGHRCRRLGHPFDAAVSNQAGRAVRTAGGARRASAIFDGDPQLSLRADPSSDLAVVDYGDCILRLMPGLRRNPGLHRGAGARHPRPPARCSVSIGGDHYVTWPLLKAHAAQYGPMALVHFDAHQDTWYDDDGRIDHGSFVGARRASRRRYCRSAPSRSVSAPMRRMIAASRSSMARTWRR